MDEFSRTELLIGKEGMQKLKNSAVAVFGIGGVGSFCAEALVRSGIGNISLFDNDKVCLTNINRQLLATRKTVGKLKVEAMKERLLDINPKLQVGIHAVFYHKDNADQFDFSGFSYIVDAIDTVSSKLLLIKRAKAAGIPIISCMGAGNKLDPTRFEVADLYSTSVDPLARIMRYECRKQGIEHLKVVYSKEEPVTPLQSEESCCSQNDGCPPDTKRKGTVRRQVSGSIAFVPSVAGLILAGEVIKDLIQSKS